MEDQHEQGATANGRYAGGRRRALLTLAGIGLLLFVVASAEVCTDRNSKSNESGDYWGSVTTAAHDSNFDNIVSSRSKGTETCNLVTQTDWDWTVSVGPAGLVYAKEAGRGGYNTDDWDCTLVHNIKWRAVHEWYNIHGEDGSKSHLDCRDLAPGSALPGCP